MSNSADKDRERGIKIVTISIRGLLGKGIHMQKLSGEAEVVAVTATWMKPRDQGLIPQVRDQSSTRAIHDRLQRFGGGVSLKINSIINYRVISKRCQGTYQSVTVRVGDLNITTAYVSLKATDEEELEL